MSDKFRFTKLLNAMVNPLDVGSTTGRGQGIASRRTWQAHRRICDSAGRGSFA